MSSQRLAAIVGAGPGNGAAFARKLLQEGYKVAVLSRKLDAMTELAASCGSTDVARGYACDVTSDESVKTAFASIQKDFGSPVSSVIYNAGSGGFKPLDQWTPEEVVQAANINAAGLFRVAKEAHPQFLDYQTKNPADPKNNLVVVGAGASTRGRPMTVGFASGKAAQRSVAQSLARAWGPEKIHVSYMIIDGLVDTPMVREFMGDKPAEFYLQADRIAEAVYSITEQHQSAWTFEFDVRPFGETW